MFRVPTPRLLVIKEDVRWKKYAPAAESMASALYMVMLLTVTPLINAIAIPVTNIGTKHTTGANSGWERILTSSFRIQRIMAIAIIAAMYRIGCIALDGHM